MKRRTLLLVLLCVGSTRLFGPTSGGNFQGPKWTAEIEFHNGLGDKLQIIDATGHLIANSGNVGTLTIYPQQPNIHGFDERFYIAYFWGEPICMLHANFSHSDRVGVRIDALPAGLKQGLRRVLEIARNPGAADKDAQDFVMQTVGELQRTARSVLAEASVQGHGQEKKAPAIITTPLGTQVEVKCVAHKDGGLPYQSRCQFYFTLR